MFHHFYGFVPSVFGLFVTIFWIWMLIDCARNPRLRGAAKVGWLLAVFFLHWIGALVYFFAGRSRGQATFVPPRSQWYGRTYQQPDLPPVYYQPSQPETYYQPPQPNEAYHGYQEGYGAVPAERQQGSETTHWHHYEEPQTSYPQLPQQELPPQEQ